jgi:hypothetical protein
MFVCHGSTKTIVSTPTGCYFFPFWFDPRVYEPCVELVLFRGVWGLYNF